MARTIRTKVYKFNELNQDAKDKAIEQFYDVNVNDSFWHEHILENFKENEDHFTIEKFYFSGFSSQGDGAMFEYSGVNGNFVNSIIDGLKLPEWKKKVLKHCSYVCGNGKQSGHYYHENSCNHSLYVEYDNGAENYDNITSIIELYADEIKEAIIDKYQDIARKLYSTLEKEYDYQTSAEAIKETIIANEYEFTITGKRF